ncbi:MAG: hypothetical protein JWO36_6903 [Myxococcales bacterium]|nr:hypothetical protein [Myxococcales bacterium]
MRIFLLLVLVASACTKSEPSTSSADKHPTAGHMGAPIAATAPVVALATVVKDPAAYKGKTFVTTGTVTAVCQSMGCWMEIKDDTSQAHIKMAGEKFFVPKTSAGHKARVQGTLTDVTGGEVECAKEASEQMGTPIAKVQLEATGVELD